MRILYSGTLDVTAGGPAMSTYLTMLGLKQMGLQPEIIQYPLVAGSRLRGEDVSVHFASASCVEHVAKQMKALYEWVLGKGEKPEFVYM